VQPFTIFTLQNDQLTHGQGYDRTWVLGASHQALAKQASGLIILTPDDLISRHPPRKPDITEEKCMGQKSANKINKYLFADSI